MSQSKIKKLRKQQALKRIGVEEVVGSEIRQIGIRQILKENWKFLLILCLGTFLLYFNSLWGDFVSDDYAAITQNPYIYEWAMGGPDPTNIINISTNLLATIFGINSPIAYHVYSLVLYLITIVVVFIFLYILFGKKVAIITTLIFSFHPIHVEAVSWISGKPYLFIGLFQLCAYICLIMYLLGKKKYLYWGILSFILTFMSDKARSLSLFFVAPMIVLFMAYSDKYEGMVKKNLFWKIVGGALVLIPIGLVLIWPIIKNRINVVNFGYRGDGSVFYDPFFQYPTGITKYLQLLLIPVDMTLYHTMYILPVWLNWLVFLLYIFSVLYFWFKDKNIFFSLIFIFLTTIPSMAPVKVSWLVAERYIFLGSLGWCLFLALVWEKYLSKFKILGTCVVIFIVCIYSVKTFVRNIDWQTNHNLWVNTVQVSPNSHNAWNNIGDDYDKLGQYDNAIKGFTQSTVMKPNYADAYHNRANIYFKTSYLQQARDSYETALGYNPGLMQTYISLTQIDLNEGKLDLALEHSSKAIELDPNNSLTRYVKAIVLNGMGLIDEAKKEAEISLRINPDFQPAKELLLKL